MAPEPERSSQVLIAQTKPEKQKAVQPQAEYIADFRFDSAKLKEIKENLGITAFNAGETLIILERLYEGLKTRDKPNHERKINITYDENKGLIREPATVLKEGTADCDEVTRTGYLLASESGVKNIVMVEMKWTDPETKKLTGHSAIVLMPQEEGGIPRIYDFTYFKKGKPLTIENNDLGGAIRKEYAADAVNPDFRIITRGNLNEVEAAHYDQVGEYYDKKNWKLMQEAYSRAVRLVQTELKYNRNLGVAFEKQGKWKDAIYYYEKCMETEEGRNTARVRAALGIAYAKTGQDNKAVEELKKALDLNPDAALSKEIKDALNLLQTRIKNK